MGRFSSLETLGGIPTRFAHSYTAAHVQVVKDALDKPVNITYKGATDLVTDTDKASEAAILEYLQQRFPE